MKDLRFEDSKIKRLKNLRNQSSNLLMLKSLMFNLQPSRDFIFSAFCIFCFVFCTLFSNVYSQVDNLHPRFNKLVNKYQMLDSYFAKSRVQVISKNLNDNTVQKQYVTFEIGYISDTKYMYFEKSHIKMMDSEQNIEIVSDGKNVYKHVTPLNQYMKMSLKDKTVVFDNINDLTLNLIFAPERIFNDMPEKIKVANLQYKMFESSDYEILYIKGVKKKELFFLILYIRKSTGLLYRWVLKTIHVHGKNRVANILKAKYHDVKYNIKSNDIKKMFKFSASSESQLVDEFDVAQYYEDVHNRLNSFVGQKLQFPKVSPINYTSSNLNLQSKYIFIEVWATWCKICKSEITLLNKLYKKYTDKLEVVGISYEKESAIKKFVEMLPKKIEYKIASYDRKNAVAPYKLVVQYPSAFLLDSNLKLKKIWVGEKNVQEFMTYFDKIFSTDK